MHFSYFWKKLLLRTGLVRFFPSIFRELHGSEAVLRYLGDRAIAAPIRELLDPALLPAVQVPDAIDLAMGSPRCELPIGSPRGVNDRRRMSPWGLHELRNEVRARLGSDEVLITHGGSGAFAAVLDAFVNPGSRVVLFGPTAPIFRIGLLHRRASIRWVETWLEKGNTRFDIEEFGRVMRGARLLVLADPSNPTGGIFAPEELEQIAWWAHKRDVLIYADESFAAFRYEPAEIALSQMPHVADRLIRAGSVSKSHGLASARIGWLAGNRHLLRPCALMGVLSAPFVSPLCQQIALNALLTGDAAVTQLRDEFAGRRQYLFESLQSLGFQPSWPSGGHFYWLAVNHLGMTGREFATRLMGSQRVLVNPGEVFDPNGEDFIRISYATEDGRLREGMQRLADFVSSLNRSRQPIPASVGSQAEAGVNAESASPRSMTT